MTWGDVGICVACSALVPARLMEVHRRWHDNIAAVAIETTARLNRPVSPKESER